MTLELQDHQLTQELFPVEQQKQFEQLRLKNNLLPPKIPHFYQQKVLKEVQTLGHKNGPLYKLVYPTKEKIELRSHGEVNDYIDDRQYIPKGTRGNFLHKYSNRVLFMPTSICLGHCMYCFRQDLLEEHHSQREKELQRDVEDLLHYLRSHPEVSELILSGGDPLMLSSRDLKWICESLSTLPSLKYFRIHTRAPIFDPSILTQEKIEILGTYNFRFVIHCVHPYELCDDVLNKLKQAQLGGLRLYNQFPLLRGVNDHLQVLTELFTKCDENNINNLSVFLPEPVLHSATYRIAFNRVLKIVRQLQNDMPAWLNSTRFCQDTPIGKVRLDQCIPSSNPNEICFERDGKTVTLPDFPEHLDEPGNLAQLLWKD